MRKLPYFETGAKDEGCFKLKNVSLLHGVFRAVQHACSIWKHVFVCESALLAQPCNPSTFDAWWRGYVRNRDAEGSALC